MAGNFRKGAEAAAEASKGGGNFAKTHFFSLDDKQKAVLRFLTDSDEWIVVDQHQMVPTKGKPADFDGNWPEKMGAVCRKDPAFEYGECYICDFVVDGKRVKKPGARTWALACVREEVTEGGKIVGYRDQTRDVTRKKEDDTEETTTEKAIVIVNMGFKNFFSILQGFAGHYGTITDRDYVIQRSGTEKDTTYSIIPLDPLEIDGQRLSKHHPTWEQRYASDLVLEDVVSARASDEFYARFFDPRYSVTGEGADKKVVVTGSEPTAKPTNDVDEGKLAAIADRVKGYGPSGDAAPASEANGAGEAVAATATPAGGGGMKNFD